MKQIHIVSCVIVNSDGKILLLHRSVGRVQWELPGGKLEVEESIEEGLAREVREELGIEVQILKILGDCNFTEDPLDITCTLIQAKVALGEPAIKELSLFDLLEYHSLSQLRRKLGKISNGTRCLVERYYEHSITLLD